MSCTEGKLYESVSDHEEHTDIVSGLGESRWPSLGYSAISHFDNLYDTSSEQLEHGILVSESAAGRKLAAAWRITSPKGFWMLYPVRSQFLWQSLPYSEIMPPSRWLQKHAD